MEEPISTPEIRRKIIPAFVSLVSRQATLQVITWFTINVLLARALPVAIIGIFDIATAIVAFFQFFSDIGLAAALIQKKESLEKEDISTTFTIQVFLVTLLTLIIIFSAPLFGSIYKLDDSGVWLIRALGLSFFLSGLKVVPTVLMERKLNFKPVVIVDVVEALILNGLLILFVYQHFGIWSYVYAVITKSIAGVILIYLLAPVKPGIGIDRVAAKKLMSFGVPYQLNNLLALLKDRLVPLVVAGMVGATGVAYIEWSQSYAFMPLQIMSIIITITFPAFSRMQDDKQALSQALEKSIFLTCLIIYPMLFGIGALLPSVINFVVSNKWQPATLSYYLFAFSVLFSVVSTILTNALNAVGYVKLTLYLMIMWTILTWVLTPILVLTYGFIGVALTSFLISFSSIVTVIISKRLFKIKILKSITLPLIGSTLMGGTVYLYSNQMVRDKFSLIWAALLGIIIYGLVVIFFARKKVLADLGSLRNG